MKTAAVVLATLVMMAAPAWADRPQALGLLAEGDALAAAGDRDGALVRYRAALAEDVDLLVVYDHAIPLWFEAGRWVEAARYLERATARHPEWAHGWYALGFIYRKTDRPAAAALAYQEYIALRPGEAEPWYGLAVSHELEGATPRAVWAWRRYLALERRTDLSSFRAEAHHAIERLLGPPRGWREGVRRFLIDGGGAAALLRIAGL